MIANFALFMHLSLIRFQILALSLAIGFSNTLFKTGLNPIKMLAKSGVRILIFFHARKYFSDKHSTARPYRIHN